MAETITTKELFDEREIVSTQELFFSAPITPVTVLDPNEEEKEIKQTLDMADVNEVGIDIAEKGLNDFVAINKKKRQYGLGLGTMLGIEPDKRPIREIFGLPEKEKVPVNFGSMAKEIPKGIARFLERDVGGTFGGTFYDWIGQFISEGGYAVDRLSRIGLKDKDRLYNPVAESIIATGQNISAHGRQAREWFSYQAVTGWEAMDEDLRERDPVSYGVGRLTEGVASSALSVLAVYLSGGASAALSTTTQVNRGLVMLSSISAAGGFEHARNQKENFYWATLHGLADGTTEYAMETKFLDGVGTGTGKLIAGAKEGAEEFFTGMLQNTRAGILENEAKGMTAYEASKKAAKDSLSQAPWEVAAGFIGGFGIAGGSDLIQIVKRSEQARKEKKLPSTEQVREKLLQDFITKAEKEGLRKPAEAVEKPPSKPVKPITKPEAVEVGALVNQGEIGVFEEDIFLPEPKEELAKTVETVRKNEGKQAAKIVKELQDVGIETIETHADKNKVTVRTFNLSEENRTILEQRENVEVKQFEGRKGDYITFEVVPTKAKVKLKTTEQKGFTELESIEAVPTGTGAGTEAIQGLIDKATKPIRLTVAKSNTKAIALYKRLGFKEITPEDPRITGIRMEFVPEVKPKAKKPRKKPVTKPIDIKRDILGDVDPLIQIHKALREAKAVRPKTEAEQRAERRRRVGAAAGAKEAGVEKAVKTGTPVEQAILKSTGLLKGPLTEYDQLYESIEESLEPDVKNAAYLQIDQHPDLRYFEVVSTTKAFQKLLAGASITPNEVQMIEKVFGKQFKEATDKQGEKSSLYDRLITYWKASLLTGLKTSGLNILSTAGHAVSETAKDVPAALIDSGVALVTGERKVAFTVKGYPTGWVEGLGKGWKYMKTGHDERNVGEKYDYKKTNFGTSKIARTIQATTDFVFHLLGAEDQPWYYGAYSRSLYSQAIAQAKTKKLKGKEFKGFVNNLQKNPTDKMLILAKEDADTAIYTNRTNLGDLGKAIQKVKGGEIIVPFARTPSAVAMQIVNYSPVGVVKEISEQIHKGEFNQRKFSQAAGRTVVGTGAMYLGTQLFKAGLIALGFPKGEKERKLWELEGKRPNSIKVDDKWRDVQAFGPVGNLLIIGGYFQQALDSRGSPTEAIIEAMAGGAKSFTEQTFVRGVNLAVDALTDPERSFERWFTSMSGSLVPTIVADIARAQDDRARRAVGPKERIQSRIPIYRRGLPPKLNVFGQDLPRYGGNVLETMIDPTRPSKIRQDAVVDELRRLWDKDIKVSPTQLGDKAGYDILTKEENTQLWQRAGELTYKALFNLVNNQAYKDAGKDSKLDPDFIKGQLIETITNKAKTAAKLEMVTIKVRQGVKLMKLAESGLYSIEEFEMQKFYGEQE